MTARIDPDALLVLGAAIALHDQRVARDHRLQADERIAAHPAFAGLVEQGLVSQATNLQAGSVSSHFRAVTPPRAWVRVSDDARAVCAAAAGGLRPGSLQARVYGALSPQRWLWAAEDLPYLKGAGAALSRLRAKGLAECDRWWAHYGAPWVWRSLDYPYNAKLVDDLIDPDER